MDLITNKGQGSLSFASGSTLFIIQGTGVEYLDCGMIYIINKLVCKTNNNHIPMAYYYLYYSSTNKF